MEKRVKIRKTVFGGAIARICCLTLCLCLGLSISMTAQAASGKKVTPVTQMAAVSVAEARVLVIQPWDKSTLKPIEKAIQASDIGINPQNDGKVIRLAFPQLTVREQMAAYKEIIDGSSLEGYRKIAAKEHEER